MSDCEELVGGLLTGDDEVGLSPKKNNLSVYKLCVRALLARGEKYVNFMPLAYKNRPYLGICDNSEDHSTS